MMEEFYSKIDLYKGDEVTLDPKYINNAVRQLTLGDIFNKTPPSQDLISSCVNRIPRSYEIMKGDEAKCKQIFSIVKFYTLEFICYRFDYLYSNESFDYGRLSNSVAWSKTIYQLGLSKVLNSYLKILWAAHIDTDLPLYSLQYAPNYDRESKEILYRYTLNFVNLITIRLPAPYAGRCLDYKTNPVNGKKSQNECYNDCVTQSVVEKFKMIPFSSLYTEKSEYINLRPLTYSDAVNVTMNASLHDIENSCHKECSHEDCQELVTFTRVAAEPNHDGRIEFALNGPIEPSFTVENKPQLTIIEYVVYILSSVGTWFGVSVIGLCDIRRTAQNLSKVSNLLGGKKRKVKEERCISSNVSEQQNSPITDSSIQSDQHSTIPASMMLGLSQVIRRQRAMSKRINEQEMKISWLLRGRSKHNVSLPTHGVRGSIPLERRSLPFQEAVWTYN